MYTCQVGRGWEASEGGTRKHPRSLTQEIQDRWKFDSDQEIRKIQDWLKSSRFSDSEAIDDFLQTFQ